MMLPCPALLWIVGMRTSRVQSEREDDGGGGWGSVIEWVLHYSNICPHSSVLLARNSLIPNVFLLGKANVGMEHSYKSAQNHDCQRPNAEWEQFRVDSTEYQERRIVESSIQAKTGHTLDHLGNLNADLIGLSQSPIAGVWKILQGIPVCSQGQEPPDWSGLSRTSWV